MRIFKKRRATFQGRELGSADDIVIDNGVKSESNSALRENSVSSDVISPIDSSPRRAHTVNIQGDAPSTSLYPSAPLGRHLSDARIKSREIAESVMKGIHFGTAVLASTARMPEVKGLPYAPRVPRAAFELSEAAEHFKEQTEYDMHQECARRQLSSSHRFHSVGHAATMHAVEDSDLADNDIFDRLPIKCDLAQKIPKPILSFSSREGVKKLTIVTFNAGLLAYKLCGKTWYQNPPFTQRRLAQVPVALKGTNADVIALQEVYDDAACNYLTNALGMLYPFVARKYSGSTFTLDNGLMLLSKFPILQYEFTPFHKVTMLEGAFGSKGILEVAVEIPGIGRVTFLNSHLASGAVDPESNALEKLRNGQIQQILQAAEAASDRQEVPLILGDMNTAPNICPSNYFGFLRLGWNDAYVDAKEREQMHHSSFASDPGLSMASTRNMSCNNFLTSKCQDSTASTAIASPTQGTTSTSAAHLSMNSSACSTLDSTALTPPSLRPQTVAGGSQKSAEGSARSESKKQVIGTNTSESMCMNISNATKPWPMSSESQHLLNYPSDLSMSPQSLRCMDYTWDPQNPLNAIGPHSDCHGQRCDHIFLPPPSTRRKLGEFFPSVGEIIFKEPSVMVEGCWFGWCGMGNAMLVTLSDHYGLRMELQIKKAS